MARKRRDCGSALKAKVALEALKESEPVSALASRFDVHPNLVSQWKRRAIDGLETLFTTEASARRRREEESDQAELYEQIGRLKMQLEWLKKKLPKSSEDLCELIDWDHERPSPSLVERDKTCLAQTYTQEWLGAGRPPDGSGVRLRKWCWRTLTLTVPRRQTERNRPDGYVSGGLVAHLPRAAVLSGGK